jgi:hypothetical protein
MHYVAECSNFRNTHFWVAKIDIQWEFLVTAIKSSAVCTYVTFLCCCFRSVSQYSYAVVGVRDKGGSSTCYFCECVSYCSRYTVGMWTYTHAIAAVYTYTPLRVSPHRTEFWLCFLRKLRVSQNFTVRRICLSFHQEISWLSLGAHFRTFCIVHIAIFMVCYYPLFVIIRWEWVSFCQKPAIVISDYLQMWTLDSTELLCVL